MKLSKWFNENNNVDRSQMWIFRCAQIGMYGQCREMKEMLEDKINHLKLVQIVHGFLHLQQHHYALHYHQ